MPRHSPVQLAKPNARQLWLRAQGLDRRAPFGAGAGATLAAIKQLGYVQIDTINVIERCHHHILYSRIPDYRRADLRQAQSIDKSIFEYWTHALSYVPAQDLPFFLPAMRSTQKAFPSVTAADLKKLVGRIERDGALSIRDIADDTLVEKDHAWASRKPSKRVLECAFYRGLLTISAREGMVKSYELTNRHFGWETPPKPASARDIVSYKLDRALRSQGIVSLDSACHLDAPAKPAMRMMIERRLKSGALVEVRLEGADRTEHWAEPQALAEPAEGEAGLVHILSPFDPLVIQRKRLALFFDYEHRFEAYVPKIKRLFGYFALPVLVGDEVAAVIDLKADRANGRLLIQQWSWVGSGERHKTLIEEELCRFERFQLVG